MVTVSKTDVSALVRLSETQHEAWGGAAEWIIPHLSPEVGVEYSTMRVADDGALIVEVSQGDTIFLTMRLPPGQWQWAPGAVQ